MTRSRTAVALTVGLLALSSYSVKADVRADEKNRVQLAGMLGRMVNLFGGKAAREGVTSTRAVKGNRMATRNEMTSQIIDLNEEKIYDLDMKKKTYKVTTFADLRRRMEEAQRKAEERARREQGTQKPEPARDRDQKEIEVDFDVRNTDQRKTINGFDTHEAIMTITLREKGETVEQGGGMVVTSDMWLAPTIAAMKEIADFRMHYAAKLAGPMVAGASAEDMAAAMAMYPMMKQAITRMNAENVKLDGTAIQTTMTFDSVRSAENMAQAAQKPDDNDTKVSPTGGIRGLAGRLAHLAARRKAESNSESSARTTFMTMTGEVLKVTTDVGASDVAIPQGFKEKR